MARALIEFFRTMLRIRFAWKEWIALLVAVNGVAPLFFLPRLEAVAALATLLLAAVIQIAVFRRRGFVRLLGVGHFPWLVLVPWIWVRMYEIEPSQSLYLWMAALVAVDSLSLTIDVVDVARYALGERAPILVAEPRERRGR